MTVTITKNLPYSEYEKLPGLRASDMKTLLKNPRAYYNAKTLGVKKEASKSMNLGSAAHTAILEPEKFADEIVVFDGAVRRGKEWDKFKAEHEGKLILNANEFDSVTEMAKAVNRNIDAVNLLREGDAEVTLEFEFMGRKFKSRLDWLNGCIIVDLKTTDDASPAGFARSIWKYAYHRQAALYMDGVGESTGDIIKGFVFVAVEKSAPYAVGVYRLDMQGEEAGRVSYQSLLLDMADCKINRNFPAYSSRIETISLPAYAVKEVYNEYE